MLHIIHNPINGLRVAIDPAEVMLITEHQGCEADAEKCCVVILRNSFQITLRDPDRDLIDSINEARMGFTNGDAR